VHYAGIGDQVDSLAELARDQEIPLIEDNAHGFGATYKNKKLGTFGALSTLSFHETKNISCGEGGALAINDGIFLNRAEILREKGTDRINFVRGLVDKYTWVDLGSSWVPSDMLAAFLLSQLENFSIIQAKRMGIWNRYNVELLEWSMVHGIKIPHVPSEAVHPAHMYFLRFQDQRTRERFIEHMRACGVMTVFHYQALNTSPMGRAFGGFQGQCPIAENASQTLVRLPLFLGMTTSEIYQVVEATLEFRP
jgi:dTDP-4-amino-4,6-dideoxygalactose transaminase